jgi:purine-binding chemotaxis protein CheW
MRVSNVKQEEERSYLVFKIGQETFAADVETIREIVELSKITKIPQSPIFYLGVANLRGSILPIIDARIKLGIEEHENERSLCTLVFSLKINNSELDIGLLVDSVEEVAELKRSQLQSPHNTGKDDFPEIIEGIYEHTNEKLIMILNLNKLFSTKELKNVSEISIENVKVKEDVS